MDLNNSQFERSMGNLGLNRSQQQTMTSAMKGMSSRPSGAQPMPRTPSSGGMKQPMPLPRKIGQSTGKMTPLPRKTMGSSMGGMGR